MIEVLKQALDYIDSVPDDRDRVGHIDRGALILALNQAIAELESQEPVAWRDVIVVNLMREGINKHRARELAEHIIKLTTPPQRTWVGLTRDEQSFVYQTLHNSTSRIDSFWVDFANAIEAKLKELNT
jgi:hypothetical protein